MVHVGRPRNIIKVSELQARLNLFATIWLRSAAAKLGKLQDSKCSAKSGASRDRIGINFLGKSRCNEEAYDNVKDTQQKAVVDVELKRDDYEDAAKKEIA